MVQTKPNTTCCTWSYNTFLLFKVLVSRHKHNHYRSSMKILKVIIISAFISSSLLESNCVV